MIRWAAIAAALLCLTACASVPLTGGTCFVFGNAAAIVVDPETNRVFYLRGGNQELSGFNVARNTDGSIVFSMDSHNATSEILKDSTDLAGKVVEGVSEGLIKCAKPGL
jgi:hypothetical protein